MSASRPLEPSPAPVSDRLRFESACAALCTAAIAARGSARQRSLTPAEFAAPLQTLWLALELVLLRSAENRTPSADGSADDRRLARLEPLSEAALDVPGLAPERALRELREARDDGRLALTQSWTLDVDAGLDHASLAFELSAACVTLSPMLALLLARTSVVDVLIDLLAALVRLDEQRLAAERARPSIAAADDASGDAPEHLLLRSLLLEAPEPPAARLDARSRRPPPLHSDRSAGVIYPGCLPRNCMRLLNHGPCS